jgi:hypothetical protein
MRKDLMAVAATLVVVASASFTAGSAWRGRHQVANEIARGRFFEAAQGQFHWPEGKKEWAEMQVPLGGFDFSEYGPRWSFTAMYEGVRDQCDLQVMVRDDRGPKREAAVQTLDRATPHEVVLDLAALAKGGLDLRHVTELTLRTRADGRAGRLLVAGLVSPRPALSTAAAH